MEIASYSEKFDQPMHSFPTTVRAVLALSLLAGARVCAAEIEPPLPDRWQPNETERILIGGFEGDVKKISPKPQRFATTPAPERIPAGFAPWWLRGQTNSIGNRTHRQEVTLEDLYLRAIRHSSQIRVFGDLPVIRETGIQEARGAFDTNAYLQSQFERTNDPVGNTLTTGGADRFKQDEWSFEAGLKKKLITGAEVSLTQKVGQIKNNSIYYSPNPQSTAKLELSITQPLLKGAGVGYNRAVIEIAKVDSEVAMAEFIRQTESHLQEIARTYWTLYAARVTYLQKLKLLAETGKLADEVKARTKIDAQSSQLFRAQSAVASRKADLIRAEAAIRNAQDRLRALTSDPGLSRGADVELIPRDHLVLTGEMVNAQQAAQTALRTRPEINQAFNQLRAATIRERMSKNELLPELNLFLKGSLGALDNGDFGAAYGREYNTGGPGFAVGLKMSIPLERNEARARHERRRLETRQQVDQIRTTVDSVLLEVKISVREVGTAYREALAKYAAVTAYAEDIATLEARRSVQPFLDPAVAAVLGAEATKAASLSQTSDYIDRMLDAQDRRARAEEEFIQAAAEYQVALVNLQRSKGKLLSYEGIHVVRDRDENNLPLLFLEKGGRDGKGVSDGKKLIHND
jgi:outer membrane protein TolC